MRTYEIRTTGRRRPILLVLGIALVVLLLFARTIASYVIEYQWWREMGQVPTWLDMLLYTLGPRAIGIVLAFLILFTAHALALKFAGVGLGRYKVYARLSSLALLLVSTVLALASIDPWTVTRFFGARNLPAESARWADPVFGNPLRFYLFDLPFWSLLLGYVLALTIVAALVYMVAARGWQLRDRLSEIRDGAIDFELFDLRGGLASRFLRFTAAAALIALALQFFLGRYNLLFNDHRFMVGVDYVDETIRLPLQWIAIGSSILAAVFVMFGRWKWVLIVPAVLIIRAVVPAAVTAAYVRPNEISIEKPYIERHIEATRAAFGLDRRAKDVDSEAKLESRFDPAQHKALLSNVRLWDWRAFHDTVTQIQALRPYYTFSDSDVDRYTVNGELRQTLLSPRELDMRQLPESARARWINPHFIYTHGYGLVMAEANQITANGLPVLVVQDAPARVNAPGLKLTRPEIYYGEVVHEPVFVHTAQPEFNYPSGSDNVFAKYEGHGGFPVSSFGMRLAAALDRMDFNILLTGYLTPESRMMIRRDVRERLTTLAGFVSWDPDPYLVLTDAGRLMWTVDGYTTSNAHPYSRTVQAAGIGSANYMRNAVKATVDAYDGTVRIYIFDPSDPIISAYQSLFPKLFSPASEMPADLREHARYPEAIFRVQAEVYRMYHMLDPQAFYNNEDMWDVARMFRGQGERPEPMSPTYIVAALPGETEPEFLLTIPFTPRNKDNLIGLMVARCDGEHLGEIIIYELSKQALIYGPMQIEARINQDQVIAKDLSLWNQQGSQVLRGQMLVLPIVDTFIYVQPIYIQASEARMPQLKKIALAMGNQLVYTDTWDQAVAALASAMGTMTVAAPQATPEAKPGQAPPAGPPAAIVPATPPDVQQRLDSIRDHLKRYRDFASQGRWAEAGKELEAVEREAQR
ncbi:MAG TPA: UPF0182 family protein [Bryobacteraceae bacterium]|nr:UPF0182 family protein [Bryobacteraceae bacterium]